jgi:hypothetical protein
MPLASLVTQPHHAALRTRSQPGLTAGPRPSPLPPLGPLNQRQMAHFHRLRSGGQPIGSQRTRLAAAVAFALFSHTSSQPVRTWTRNETDSSPAGPFASSRADEERLAFRSVIFRSAWAPVRRCVAHELFARRSQPHSERVDEVPGPRCTVSMTTTTCRRDATSRQQGQTSASPNPGDVSSLQRS